MTLDPKEANKRSPFEARLNALEKRLHSPLRKPVLRFSRQDSPLIHAGIEFFSGVVVSMLLGVAFDRYQSTHPWGLLTGFLLGLGAGFWNVFRLIKR
ncbi:MAG: AtpZ/AtpI family protein [Holosporales bacterium]|jgi:F0F1-type ATP synthase assembly protein I|nr:AtpZ/AtpI family protein [Holosporales bacterium]